MASIAKARIQVERRLAVISGRPPKSRVIRSDQSLARLPILLWHTRRRHGMSISSMAVSIGMRPARLADFEAGNRLPKRSQLEGLAQLMGIDFAALMILWIAARTDRLFLRGSPTVSSLHRSVLNRIEGEADLRPRGAK